jgi:hypothetical protein
MKILFAEFPSLLSSGSPVRLNKLNKLSVEVPSLKRNPQ